jgi:hypothetical protein
LCCRWRDGINEMETACQELEDLGGAREKGELIEANPEIEKERREEGK